MNAPAHRTATNNSDTRDVVRGALVNFIGVLARSLNFFFYMLLARLFGVEQTGLYLLAWATVDVTSKLAILGLDRGVLTRAAKHHASQDETGLYNTIGQALLMGCGFSVVMIIATQILAEPIGVGIYDKRELVTPLRIMSLGMLASAVSAILLFATRALRLMRYEVLVKSVTEPLVLLAAAGVAYFLGLGLFGLALSFLFSTVAGMVVSIVFFGKELSYKRTLNSIFCKNGRGALFGFAAPIGIYDMLNLMLQRVDMFMVGRYLSSSMVGVYGIAAEVAYALKKVRQSFDPIFIPVIAAARQRNDLPRASEQYQNVTRWILSLDAAAFGVIVLAGPAILNLFGPQFTVGYPALVLLSLSIVINGVAGVSELFVLIDRPVINLVNSAAAMIVNVALNLILIPRWGIAGAALSITVSYTLMNGARLVEVIILYGLQPFSRYHGRVLGAAALSFVPCWLILRLWGGEFLIPQIGAAIGFLALYTTLVWLFKPAPEERQMFKRLGQLVRWREE